MAGANGTTLSIKAARPAIGVDGQVDESLARGLLSLMIVESSAGLYRCEAQFGNWGSKDRSIGYLYFDRQTLDFGKRFAVKIDRDSIFEGRIVGLEAVYPAGQPPRLTVLAEDRFQDLRMTRRTRTFENIADSDLIDQIAQDHRLTSDIDVSGPTHALPAQVNQT